MRKPQIIFLLACLSFTVSLYAQESSSESSVAAKNEINPFAQQFLLPPSQRLNSRTFESKGLLFVEKPNRGTNSRYGVVTNFGPGVLKSQAIFGVSDLQALQKLIKENLTSSSFQGVDVKQLNIPIGQDHVKTLYWVGQKSFPSLEAASSEIAMLQTVVEKSGGSFAQVVAEAQTAVVEEPEPQVEIKSPAQQEKEEALVLNYLDKIDFGEKLFGVLQGSPTGESIVWQSFGETSWRLTNLESHQYDSQTFFWTNRIVFKGIKFPFNTIDPYVEAVPALESNGVDYASNLKLFAGVEWRPFARNALVYNFRPWGGIALLEFIRNYRFYLQYGDRSNIKDEITGSANYDLISGVSIFYEWGVELPPLEQPKPQKFSEYVEQYVWGEYFGDYRYEKTNFGAEDDFNAFIWNSNITLGIKTPAIPLPANPLTDELVLMPYMRFEHVNNSEFSFPYQNRYFVAAGLRWMPFRNYRWKENEWLSKTKVFGEWVGVGRVQNTKQDGEAPYAVDYDLRFGVSFSSRRF